MPFGPRNVLLIEVLGLSADEEVGVMRKPDRLFVPRQSVDRHAMLDVTGQ